MVQPPFHEPGTGRPVTGSVPMVEPQPPVSGFGARGLGGGTGAKILTVHKVNEARERNVRALKSLLAFVLFIAFAVAAVTLIVNV